MPVINAHAAPLTNTFSTRILLLVVTARVVKLGLPVTSCLTVQDSRDQNEIMLATCWLTAQLGKETLDKEENECVFGEWVKTNYPIESYLKRLTLV